MNITHITIYLIQLIQNNNQNEFYNDDELYAKQHLMNEVEGVFMCEW